MRLLRALAGSVLWILAGVLGLLGVVLSVTIILLPVGIPLLMLSRRLFRYTAVLFLPREVRHPVQELGKSTRDQAGKAGKAAGKVRKRGRKKGRKLLKRVR